MAIRISDACPIQLWVNGTLTYNEQNYGLIDEYPFYQEFLPTDKIRIQFIDDSSERDYALSVFIKGKLFIQIPFAAFLVNGVYVHDLAFVPKDDWGVTEDYITLKITSVMEELFANSQFTSDLSSWTLRRFDAGDFYSEAGWVYRASAGGAAQFQFSNTYKKCQASQIFGTGVKPAGTYQFTFQSTWDNFDYPSYTILYRITTYYFGEFVSEAFTQVKTTAPLSSNLVNVFADVPSQFDRAYFEAVIVEDLDSSFSAVTVPPLSDAVDVPFVPGGPAWNVGIAEPSVSIAAPNVYSDNLQLTLGSLLEYSVVGLTKKVKVKLDVTTTYPIYVFPALIDVSSGEHGAAGQVIYSTGLYDLEFSIDAAVDISKLQLMVASQSESDGSDPSAVVVVKQFGASIPSLGPTMFLEYLTLERISLDARSDEVKISYCIEDNTALTYGGNKNCYGLIYGVGLVAPDTFMLRIPGLFYHERHITKQKTIFVPGEQFNSAQALKKQKLLTVFDAPDYFHAKVLSALAHSVVGLAQINQVDWTVEENYEDDGERPESYPMSGKKIWLTRRNYSKRVFT